MGSEDRLDRLERRMQDLEDLVRQLLTAAAPRPFMRSPTARVATPASSPAADPKVTPSPARPAPVTPRPPQPGALAVGTEQWFGQRGLLGAGVFLLILAAGYFLKLAFDRGWVSPLLRCSGGAILGFAVAGTGWSLYQRGLRTYGAALMGCGAAIAYLAVWAAVRLYDLVPVTVGLGAMALLSVATFGLAWVVNVEALAAAAAPGAFLAPMVIGRSGNANVLLLYSFFLTAGLGAVSQKRWRFTTFVIGASFFTLGAAATLSARIVPANAVLYGVLGASAGLAIGLRERWTETRFLSYWGGWLVLWLAATFRHDGPGLVISAGGILLAAPIWWHAWRDPAVWPDQSAENRGMVRAESWLFYATPFWLAWAMAHVAPAWLSRHEWAVPLLISLCYLAAGYLRPRIAFAIVGTTAALFAAVAAWSGVPVVWALLALGLLWAGLDHRLHRSDGRWYALLAVAVALVHLLPVDLNARPPAAPAFVDAWALSLWLATIAVGVLAVGLWRQVQPASPAPAPRPGGYWDRGSAADIPLNQVMPALLWVISGALLFGGVTNELTRFFHQTVMTPANARLAGGLAVSAWWALFAGGLVAVGFERKLKPARVAGLVVSGLAVVKVLLFDLSTLDALYRIASVFTLGLVSLGVAYLYHRQAAGAQSTAAGDDPAPPAA